MQATYTQGATTLATITRKLHFLLMAWKNLLNVSAARRNLKRGPKLAHLKTAMGLDFFLTEWRQI